MNNHFSNSIYDRDRWIRQLQFLNHLHAWLAWVCLPFASVALLTGIIYLFAPIFEWMQTRELVEVPVEHTRYPLSRQVQAAQDLLADQGLQLHSVELANNTAGASTVVYMIPRAAPNPVASGISSSLPHPAPQDGHQHGEPTAGKKGPRPPGFGLPEDTVIVYVNPHTLTVLGTLPHKDLIRTQLKKLHSSLWLGRPWRVLIELAASGLWMMLGIGCLQYLLRKKLDREQSSTRGVPSIRMRLKGSGLRLSHGQVAIAVLGLSVLMISTGLTWSLYAGNQIRSLRDWTGQGPKPLPKHLEMMAATEKPDWDKLLNFLQSDLERGATEEDQFQKITIAAPSQDKSAQRNFWKVTVEMDNNPVLKKELFIAPSSDTIAYERSWKDLTAFGKATAVGIPFHRGDLGWWNQALLIVFAITLAFGLWSGWKINPLTARSWLRPQSAFSWQQMPWPFIAYCIVSSLIAPMLGLLLILFSALHSARVIKRLA